MDKGNKDLAGISKKLVAEGQVVEGDKAEKLTVDVKGNEDSRSGTNSKDLAQSSKKLGIGRDYGKDDEVNLDSGCAGLSSFPGQGEITEGADTKNSGEANSREDAEEEIITEEDRSKRRSNGRRRSPLRHGSRLWG